MENFTQCHEVRIYVDCVLSDVSSKEVVEEETWRI